MTQQKYPLTMRQLLICLPLLLGFLVMYFPSYQDAAMQLWGEDDHAHSPLILLIVLFLAFQKREQLFNVEPRPMPILGGVFLVIGLLFYIVGRSQEVFLFDLGSQIPVLIGLLLFFLGWPGIRILWFPVIFLVFLIPIPGFVVTALTAPLQEYVSKIAEEVLFRAGYPIARSGVILYVGPYQLFVANACSGLNSMFSLSAMGLLYLYLMNYRSVARNLLLLLSILPFAFLANVIRVIILILITYHLGDAAGQGPFHGFTGIVLFVIALALLFIWDGILGLLFFRKKKGQL